VSEGERLKLLSLREAEREYGVPRRFLAELPITQRDKRSKLVQRADVEEFIARDWRCQGCGEPLETGRTWHPRCRVTAMNREMEDDPDKAAARSERMSRSSRKRWDDPVTGEQQRTNVGAATAARVEQAKAALKARRDVEGLLDAVQVEKRIHITAKYVGEIARKLGLGQPVTLNGKRRLLFSADDVAEIERVTGRDGGPSRAAGWDRAKQRVAEANGWYTTRNAAREIDRSVDMVRYWARKLNVGQWHALGGSNSKRRMLWLTSQDIDAIRTEIARGSYPAASAHRDAASRLDWLRKTHNPPETSPTLRKLYGQLPPAAGSRPRGRTPKLTLEQKLQIDTLAAQGFGDRPIADQIGVKRDVVRYYRSKGRRSPR